MAARLRNALAAALLAFAAGPAAADTFTMVADPDRFQYALVDPGPDEGSSFSATSASWEEITRLMETHPNERFFWFVREGKAWIVKDAAIFAEARRILEPVRDLGLEQGRVGAKQGFYGDKQGRIGAEQGRLGARQGELGARVGELALRRGESYSARVELEAIRLEMEELARSMAALGRRHEPFGARQAALGSRQAELGRRQAEASQQASVALRRLADRALDEGRARSVPR